MMTSQNTGNFFVTDGFLDDFTFAMPDPNTHSRIDMNMFDYSPDNDTFDYYKKRYPLLEDDIINFMVKLTLQERQQTIKQEKQPTAKPKKTTRKDKNKVKDIQISRKPVCIDFN